MSEVLSGAVKVPFETRPVAPLGIIAMPGTERICDKINAYLQSWR